MAVAFVDSKKSLTPSNPSSKTFPLLFQTHELKSCLSGPNQFRMVNGVDS